VIVLSRPPFLDAGIIVSLLLFVWLDSLKAQLKTHLFAKAYLILLFVRRPCSDMVALLRHINCRNYYCNCEETAERINISSLKGE